jgi:hypothetical protein
MSPETLDTLPNVTLGKRFRGLTPEYSEGRLNPDAPSVTFAISAGL